MVVDEEQEVDVELVDTAGTKVVGVELEDTVDDAAPEESPFEAAAVAQVSLRGVGVEVSVPEHMVGPAAFELAAYLVEEYNAAAE